MLSICTYRCLAIYFANACDFGHTSDPDPTHSSGLAPDRAPKAKSTLVQIAWPRHTAVGGRYNFLHTLAITLGAPLNSLNVLWEASEGRSFLPDRHFLAPYLGEKPVWDIRFYILHPVKNFCPHPTDSVTTIHQLNQETAESSLDSDNPTAVNLEPHPQTHSRLIYAIGNSLSTSINEKKL